MNREAVEKIANAVLYEGYMLYPYRASSIKNRQRFNFGVLYPNGFDTAVQRTECLVCEMGAVVDIVVRYLRLDETEKAHERSIDICGAAVAELVQSPLTETDGVGEASVSAQRTAAPNCHRLRIEVRNIQPLEAETAREKVLCHSMISVHTILSVREGSFVSLLDPPVALAEAARECRNMGTWPVLAGDEGSHDAMLSSPIILYDYPQIAPESPQNLFDGTEIDEILTLRIMTLTDDEKTEIRSGDERIRALLDRTENMPPEHLMKLHGALRSVPGTNLRKGHQVRLWPQKRADIMDIALKGRVATIDAIEEDLDGNVHFAVVIDDDPGRDLGEMRQPGHRFFFGPEEVEPL